MYILVVYTNSFEWYTMDYPMSHVYFLVYTRVLRRVCRPRRYKLYHQKGLHNYFIPCHTKYNGQMERLGMVQLNYTDRWEGSVEY